MNKSITFTILITVIMLITGCSIRREPQAMVNLEKLEYAFDLWAFDFQMFVDGEVVTIAPGLRARDATDPRRPEFDPFYNEFILVHSEAEAQGFPDSTIVAWPREDNGHGLIIAIHWIIEENPYSRRDGTPGREFLTLEDFGLTYPLTLEDLVDNWEKVNELWRAFNHIERDFIRHHANAQRNQPPENAIITN